MDGFELARQLTYMLLDHLPVAAVKGGDLWGDVGEEEGILESTLAGAIGCRTEVASVKSGLLIIDLCGADVLGEFGVFFKFTFGAR